MAVDHCGICDFRHLCRDQRVEDDHPILVAGLARLQAERLAAHGITTLTALGEAAPDTQVKRHAAGDVRAASATRPSSSSTSRAPASTASSSSRTRRTAASALLPEPPRATSGSTSRATRSTSRRAGSSTSSAGATATDGEIALRGRLGRATATARRRAFERFVDWVEERRRVYPDMHVYHYAAYERTALRRLMGEHGDARARDRRLAAAGGARRPLPRRQAGAARRRHELLDQGDREALRVRAHGRGRGRGRVGRPLRAVARGAGATRCSTGSAPTTRRTAARRSRSTSGCSGCGRRSSRGGCRRSEREQRRRPRSATRRGSRCTRRCSRARRRASPSWLLAQLLDYHQREAKPQWWEWFHHLALDEDELIEDTDTIGGLELVGEPARTGSRSSTRSRSRRRSTRSTDARSIRRPRRRYDVSTSTTSTGLVTLRRAKERADEPLPRGADSRRSRSPTRSSATRVQRFARGVPRRRARRRGARDPRAAAAARAARPAGARGRALARRQLPLRAGPARLGQDVAGREGGGRAHARGPARRRHVAQPQGDHKLLDEIEREAREQGFAFRGRKKSTAATRARASRGEFVDCARRLARPARRGAPARRGHVVALRARGLRRASSTRCSSTRRARSRSPTRSRSATRRGTSSCSATRTSCRRSRRARMPDEAKASGPPAPARRATTTVPPDRGIFLERTWRLRPELTAFTSEAYYEGRLECEEMCARRSVAAGNGLVFRPVEHAANGQLSREEADEVAARDRARCSGRRTRTRAA